MATSQPKKGRPRRPEGIKRLKLRESTYNLWIERKEALGVEGITNSEFAEMLLHQNLASLRIEITIDLVILCSQGLQH